MASVCQKKLTEDFKCHVSDACGHGKAPWVEIEIDDAPEEAIIADDDKDTKSTPKEVIAEDEEAKPEAVQAHEAEALALSDTDEDAKPAAKKMAAGASSFTEASEFFVPCCICSFATELQRKSLTL